MNTQITIDETLSLAIGAHAVQLEADEALDLAADLARCAFRRIAAEEQADFLFDDTSEDISTEGLQ